MKVGYFRNLAAVCSVAGVSLFASGCLPEEHEPQAEALVVDFELRRLELVEDDGGQVIGLRLNRAVDKATTIVVAVNANPANAFTTVPRLPTTSCS